METLIELYDERPIENVLASEVFRPRRTVFLCPPDVAQSRSIKNKLQKYFRHIGLSTELLFLESSLYSSDKVAKQLRAVTEKYPDCVMDITGGTDAALFACGLVCAEADIPAFTYSRRRNCFYNIHRAPFAEPLPCTVRHSVAECFMMAGGAVRDGRVDNAVLKKHTEDFDPFFQIYLRHRTEWVRAIDYIQRASQAGKNAALSLTAKADYTIKGERGNRISAPERLFCELEAIGFLRDVEIRPDRVSFTFRDAQIRTWLRDVGRVLELYVYKVCAGSGLFNDVHTSVVVDWDGDFGRDSVTNEIDVMAMHGVLPFFISCKTCAVGTEALNELAVLRDRFGGHGAKAIIVTAQNCRAVTRHRASELGIDIIDLADLRAGRIDDRIRSVLRQDR